MQSPVILYEEVQTLDRKGTRILFQVVIGLLLLGYILIYFITRREDKKEYLGLITAVILAVSIVFLFTRAKLVTRVRTDGIYVSFQPLQAPAFFPWENISNIYLRQYDPIREYGGWGVRIGPSGKALIVSGKTGLQLVLKDNTRILIGTDNPDQLAEILTKMNKHFPEH
jgi:hypothetical protein